MTFKEMTEECIALLGEEYSASEEEVRSLHVRLGKCVNYAYERIARQYYHPVKTEKAVTDARCRLKKSELSESFWYLRGVKCAGREVAACSEGSEIFVGHTPNSEVEITYSYVPHYMVSDTDKPCIPQGEVSPTAYIFAALCIFMESEGRHEDAAVWNAQAEAALSGSIYRPAHPMPVRRWQ